MQRSRVSAAAGGGTLEKSPRLCRSSSSGTELSSRYWTVSAMAHASPAREWQRVEGDVERRCAEHEHHYTRDTRTAAMWSRCDVEGCRGSRLRPPPNLYRKRLGAASVPTHGTREDTPTHADTSACRGSPPHAHDGQVHKEAQAAATDGGRSPPTCRRAARRRAAMRVRHRRSARHRRLRRLCVPPPAAHAGRTGRAASGGRCRHRPHVAGEHEHVYAGPSQLTASSTAHPAASCVRGGRFSATRAGRLLSLDGDACSRTCESSTPVV